MQNSLKLEERLILKQSRVNWDAILIEVHDVLNLI